MNPRIERRVDDTRVAYCFRMLAGNNISVVCQRRLSARVAFFRRRRVDACRNVEITCNTSRILTPIPLGAVPLNDDGMYPNLASCGRPALFVLLSCCCTPSKYVTGFGSTPLEANERHHCDLFDSFILKMCHGDRTRCHVYDLLEARPYSRGDVRIQTLHPPKCI